MDIFVKDYRDDSGRIIKISLYPENSIALRVDHSIESKITDRTMFRPDSKMYRAVSIIMRNLSPFNEIGFRQ